MKNSTLIYLVVILMIINIAALGTIVYERYTRNRMPAGEMRPFGPRYDSDGQRPGQEFDRSPMRDLDLSQEQRSQFRQSRRQLWDRISGLTQELEAKRETLFVEMSRQQPDTTLIFQLVEDIGDLETSTQKQVVAHMLRDGALLTPEQRERLLRGISERAFGKGWQGRGDHFGDRQKNRKP